MDGGGRHEYPGSRTEDSVSHEAAAERVSFLFAEDPSAPFSEAPQRRCGGRPAQVDAVSPVGMFHS